MENSQRVLVVCTANVCRSPLAQRVLQAADLPIEVTSAGLHALTGAPMCAVSAAELPGKPIASESPAEEPLAEDPLAVDEAPAQDPRTAHPPAEDVSGGGLPAEAPPAEDSPTDEPLGKDLPAQDVPSEVPSAEGPPAEVPPEENLTEDLLTIDPSVEDLPHEDPPAEEYPEEVPRQHLAHVARQVDADAVRAADLVVAMEREQRGALVRAAPGSQAKVFTLREAATFATALAERGAAVPDLAAAARAMHSLRGLVTVPERPAPPRRWFRRPADPSDPLTIADGHGAADPEHRAAVQEVHDAADRLAASLRAILSPFPHGPTD